MEWSKQLKLSIVQESHRLVLQATSTPAPSILDIPADALRQLVHQHGIVSLLNFAQDNDTEGLAKHIGKVLLWPQGNVLDIKMEEGTSMNPNSQEAMPMHYDGMFKKPFDDAKSLGDVPLFQFFHCVQAYPSKEKDENDGCTLFVDSRRLLNEFSAEEKKQLEDTTLCYRTTLYDHHDYVHTSPMIIQHPVTQEQVLRYHEPWGRDKTQFHTIDVTMPDDDDGDINKIHALLLPRLYSSEFCYSHRWTQGEYLIADNVALLHARTPMRRAGRHVRRVHIN